MSNEQRLIDVLSTDSGKQMSGTALAKWLGLNRSYLYELARKTGYQRVNGEWVTSEDHQAHADLSFQMLSEIHDAVVNGTYRDNKGRQIIDLPESNNNDVHAWEELTIDGEPHLVVPVRVVESAEQRSSAYADVDLAVKNRGEGHRRLNENHTRQVLSMMAGLTQFRLNEI